MSAPTAKKILEAFPKLGFDKAKELAEKLEAALKSDDENAIDEVMEVANQTLDGNDVEGIQAEGGYKVDDYWRDTILLYVNLGETYEPTICYDTEGEEFFIGSWGDFVEEWEKEEDEEDGEEEEEDEDEDEESDDDTSSLEKEGTE